MLFRSDLEELDTERRLGRTASEISKLRAQAMEKFYVNVVEDWKYEGLIVKDLASPYLFGVRKFWWKFKPIYESDEVLDIDVSILQNIFWTYSRIFGLTLIGVILNR